MFTSERAKQIRALAASRSIAALRPRPCSHSLTSPSSPIKSQLRVKAASGGERRAAASDGERRRVNEPPPSPHLVVDWDCRDRARRRLAHRCTPTAAVAQTASKRTNVSERASARTRAAQFYWRNRVRARARARCYYAARRPLLMRMIGEATTFNIHESERGSRLFTCPPALAICRSPPAASPRRCVAALPCQCHREARACCPRLHNRKYAATTMAAAAASASRTAVFWACALFERQRVARFTTMIKSAPLIGGQQRRRSIACARLTQRAFRFMLSGLGGAGRGSVRARAAIATQTRRTRAFMTVAPINTRARASPRSERKNLH